MSGIQHARGPTDLTDMEAGLQRLATWMLQAADVQLRGDGLLNTKENDGSALDTYPSRVQLYICRREIVSQRKH